MIELKEEVEAVSSSSNSSLSSINKNLFSNVRYFLINSDHSQIEELLNLNGAKEDKYLSSFITHVICDNPDNSDYLEAKEVFDLTIVKSEWVKKCIMLNTILPVEAFSPDSNVLFSGVKAVNLNLNAQIAKPIMAMINYYGGQVLNELSEDCTHIFALDYDNFASKLETSDNLKQKIITPDWVIDCIDQNRILDEIAYNPKYLVTNPDNKEILLKLKQDEEEKKKEIEESKLVDETEKTLETTTKNEPKHLFKTQLIPNDLFLGSEKPFGSPTPLLAHKKLNQMEKRHSIEFKDDNSDLAHDLSASNIQAQLEKTIRLNEMLSFSNETHLNNFNNQTTTKSIQSNDTVGVPMQTDSLKIINVTPPHAKSKPKRPRKQSTGISPLSSSSTQQQQQQQTNSNFNLEMNEIFQTVLGNINNIESKKEEKNTSEVKTSNIASVSSNNNAPVLPIYLNLIRPPNGQNNVAIACNNQMSAFDEDSVSQDTYFVQENSHLIQFDRCLLGCVFYIRANDSYYTEECLLDWQQVIEKFGGRIVNDYDSFKDEVTHVLCPNRFSQIYRKAIEDKKRTVTAYWVEDVLQEQKLRPPWIAYHFPSPFEIKNGPLSNHIISTHGFSGREKLIIKTLIRLMNGKYSSYLSNINSFLISKNADGIKYEKAKKWNINIVNGIWLMELYLGNTLTLNKKLDERYTNLNVNHFGYDNIFVCDFMEQWKTLIKLPLDRLKDTNTQSNSNTPLRQLNRSPLKRRNRSRSTSPAHENSKIIKKETGGGISWFRPQSSIPIIMFTGFNQDELVQYQRDVISLNGIISKQCAQTTHLVVDKIERTAKLLKCISTCDYIVNIKWLIDSKLEGRFKDPNDYQVKDDSFENHYSCCLKDSLLRARERKPLFAGFMFYLSPSVRPSYTDLEEMIKSAGGIVLRDVPTFNQFNEVFYDEKQTGLTSKYIVIGSQNDLCILKPFIEKKIPIYHEELVLSGLLRQKIEAYPNKFHSE